MKQKFFCIEQISRKMLLWESVDIKIMEKSKKLKKNFHFPTLFGKKDGAFLCEKE